MNEKSEAFIRSLEHLAKEKLRLLESMKTKAEKILDQSEPNFANEINLFLDDQQVCMSAIDELDKEYAGITIFLFEDELLEASALASALREQQAVLLTISNLNAKIHEKVASALLETKRQLKKVSEQKKI